VFAHKLVYTKNNTPLIALTSLVLAFAGCSKHSPTAALQKNIDMGVIEVSGGKPSSQILADGRTCTITTTVFPGGTVNLTATLIETNVSGVKELSRSVQVPGVPDKPYTISIGQDTIITVKLHM
jgi:hypothetical protein